MESFNRTTGFRYHLNSNGDCDEFSGILEIYAHHARNIHNICIYENQDVYAKFSLTYNPDEALSTRIINGGGKNPEFNEKLSMKITQLDAVLKCEIWMLSRARNYMEDQLLGFTLVPISLVIGKGGKLTQDYTLSSTDLFHSPAGTVKLTLSLNTCNFATKTSITTSSSLSLSESSSSSSSSSANNSSITSEVVLLDPNISQLEVLDPVEYSRIEFPDVGVVNENQKMVSEYFNLTRHDDDWRPNTGSKGLGSFLHLGASPPPPTPPPPSPPPHHDCDLDTPTSRNGREDGGDDEKEEEPRIGNINMNMEAEQTESAMQQQIVHMYMRSMQQFTESLAKMKLPMDLDQREDPPQQAVIPNASNNLQLDHKNKDGSRVFYGSRAFF